MIAAVIGPSQSYVITHKQLSCRLHEVTTAGPESVTRSDTVDILGWQEERGPSTGTVYTSDTAARQGQSPPAFYVGLLVSMLLSA